MKQIILSIDYELFLGKDTGSVKSCMIEPTEKLAKYLSVNRSKMTVFWDILHFYKLQELENKFPELKKDRIAIQNQIVSLAEQGHDIQLHLHPHWLDANFLDGKWEFTYERFKLHSLTDSNKTDDINSILGCITIAKNLMEKVGLPSSSSKYTLVVAFTKYCCNGPLTLCFILKSGIFWFLA